jgi:hypothetical protein
MNIDQIKFFTTFFPFSIKAIKKMIIKIKIKIKKLTKTKKKNEKGNKTQLHRH